MRTVDSKMLAIVAASALSLTGFAMAKGHGGGPMNNPGLSNMSAQGLQSSQFGRTTAETARTKNNSLAAPSPKPTPRGHHYGWQKGKHNPHHSPTPMATP